MGLNLNRRQLLKGLIAAIVAPAAWSSHAAREPAASNVRIVNAFDTGVIKDYMGSTAGEEIIMRSVRGTVK
jgi:hypothetical protein